MAAQNETYKALQTDKDNLSRLLYSQEPRRLAFAAELGRYTANCRDLRIADTGVAHPMWVHEGECKPSDNLAPGTLKSILKQVGLKG